jgi:hypothetical protein
MTCAKKKRRDWAALQAIKQLAVCQLGLASVKAGQLDTEIITAEMEATLTDVKAKLDELVSKLKKAVK